MHYTRIEAELRKLPNAVYYGSDRRGEVKKKHPRGDANIVEGRGREGYHCLG